MSRACARIASVVTAFVSFAPTPARSATIDWINPAGGTFQVGSNWAGGTVPGSSDTARFALTSPIDVTFSAGVTNDRLIVASGADVTFHTFSFNVVINSAASPGIVIGDTASLTPARLDLATGRLGAFDIVLGDQLGAAGIGRFESGSWGSARMFTVGNAGDGTFIATGGLVNLTSVTLGSAATGRGFMQVDAAFLGTNGPLRIGGAGAGTLLITGGTDIGTGPVVVGDSAGSSGTIDLRSNVEWAIGTMTVGNAGNGTLLIGQGTMAGSGTACIAQQPGSRGWFSIAGGSVTFGDMNVGGSATAAGGDGTFILDAGSISIFRAIRAWDHGNILWNDGTLDTGSIDLRGGGIMTMAPAARSLPKLLKTKNVAIDLDHGSKLDLNENDAALTATNRSLVESYIESARNGGDWNGAGLTSSAAKAQASHATTLGVLSGAEYRALNGNTFDGSAVANSDVLVKYTYYGDTDFNSIVNFDDYVRTDSGFNNSRSGWLNGDFDLNGVVNFDDYVLIDLAFNTQSGTLGRALSYLDGTGDADTMRDPALRRVVQHAHEFGDAYVRSFLAAVPEPATVGLMGAMPVIVGRRARSRRVKSVGEDRLRGSRRQGTALLAMIPSPGSRGEG